MAVKVLHIPERAIYVRLLAHDPSHAGIADTLRFCFLWTGSLPVSCL